MDSSTLLLLVVPLMMGLVFNAMRFMRFVGFLTGARRKSSSRNSYSEDHLSFDERVAERLRDLDRETRQNDAAPSAQPIPQGFGRRQA